MNATAEVLANGPRLDLTPPPGEAARVEAVTAPFAAMLGRVPAALQLLGLSPSLLEHYVGTLGYYMAHQTLGEPLKTFIRYLVSSRGECAYCIDLNEAFLVQAGVDLDVARASRRDPSLAPLPEMERALLAFALDVVDRPEAVDGARIEALRGLGWSDRDIFDAAWHAAQNRAIGLVADAFGLPPENLLG